MADVLKSPLFLDDLDGAAGYIAGENPAAAQRFVAAVEQTIELLSRAPQIGQPLATTKYPKLRRMSVCGFRVYQLFYEFAQDEVRVHRLVHGSRDLPAVLES